MRVKYRYSQSLTANSASYLRKEYRLSSKRCIYLGLIFGKLRCVKKMIYMPQSTSCKMKHQSIYLYITILKFLQSLTSAADICEEGNTGYIDCRTKNAICVVEGEIYRCICPEGVPLIDDQCGVDNCRSESEGYRFCESSFARCRNDPETTDGYVCFCPEGQSEVDGFCKDNPELTRTQDTETMSSLSSLSSTITSNTDIENTPSETLHSSFKTDLLFTTLQPIEISSKSSISLTTVDDYLGSTNEVSVSDIIDDDKCLNLCSHNMTCIRLSRRLTCRCKVGFVPYENHPPDKSSCIRNCLQSGCEETCRQMKCILPEEKKKNSKRNADLEMLTGWPLPAILVCAFLGCIIVVLIFIIVYLLHKYVKTKPCQQLEDNNKVVYQKMNRGLHTESVSCIAQRVLYLLPFPRY